MTESPTSTRSSKLVGALVGALAALSIGGVGVAFAQEAETPTTQAPAGAPPATPEADPTPGERQDDCPEKDDESGDSAASTETADQV